MSRRPTDWSPLAGSDPVRGDPDEIERAARSLADVAEEITRQAANLRKLSTAEGWDADAGRTFAGSAAELASQLGKACGRYSTAGGALKRYAPELRHAQSMADAALAEAKQAQNTINANQPSAYSPAGSPSPDEATTERHRQYAHDEGISALQAAHRKLAEATNHRDEHAGRATRAIRENIDDDGLKDSWWDGFTNWVHEHADILTAIAKIAEEVASVLGTISLFVSCIPGLNVLVLGLAALASGVALACNLMLALAGDGSWLNVAVDLFALVTFGYGAKAAAAERTLAKELAERSMEKELPDLARNRAVENMAEAQKTGVRPPTGTSAAVDRATGKVYYGKSGSIPDSIHPDLASRMPDPSLEPWPSGNCAEFHAVNEALSNGAKLKDISYATVRTRPGVNFPSCANCQVSLSGAREIS